VPVEEVELQLVVPVVEVELQQVVPVEEGGSQLEGLVVLVEERSELVVLRQTYLKQ
jgi:hypothetical protein